MVRLQWDGNKCVNPPKGWDVAIYRTYDGDGYWDATQRSTPSASYRGPDTATEAEAKRACEAALLRLGVLEPEADWVNAADVLLASVGSRDADDRRRAVIAVARALAALEVEVSDV